MRQQREQPLLGHRAAPGDAEHLIVAGEPSTVEPPPDGADDG
jgi:hypothetical protein